MALLGEAWQKLARIGPKYGRFSGMVSRIAVLSALIVVGIPESPAEATVLKNGVRAGDRSGLTIIRPPRAGQSPFNRNPFTSSRSTRRGPIEAHKWFWQIHTPSIPASGVARWESALRTLRDRRRRVGPIHAPATMARIAAAWTGPIGTAARTHRVSEALILAVIAVESAGREQAKSHKGAQGLMQLIPATATRFGVHNAYDGAANIDGGAAYLSFLLDKFRGDVILALAGYNAGAGAVERHGGVPPYAETRDYVVKVLDALVAAEDLCLDAPAGPRFACVWQPHAS